MAKELDKELVVDKRFSLPPGVTDVRNDQEIEGSSIGGGEDSTDGLILETAESAVPLPTSYSVVDQKIRFTADGRSVVDVTLEFPDSPLVDSIEVKVTKL